MATVPQRARPNDTAGQGSAGRRLVLCGLLHSLLREPADRAAVEPPEAYSLGLRVAQGPGRDLAYYGLARIPAASHERHAGQSHDGRDRHANTRHLRLPDLGTEGELAS